MLRSTITAAGLGLARAYIPVAIVAEPVSFRKSRRPALRPILSAPSHLAFKRIAN
jgi:hypothetical protein